MENVKHWILTHCKHTEGQASDQSKVFANVVTPDSIPQFTIPGSPHSSCSEDIQHRGDGLSLPASVSSSHRYSTGDIGNHTQLLTIPSPTQSVRSAPASPSRPYKGFLDGDTNADPLSLAAVSLPHFRTTTGFGFETVSENPHVRRKESLFHEGPRTRSPLLPRWALQKKGSHESFKSLSPRSTSHGFLNKVDSDWEDGNVTKERESLSRKQMITSPLGVYVVCESPSGSIDSGSLLNSDNPTNPLFLFSPASVENKNSGYYYRRRSSLSVESERSICSVSENASHQRELSQTNESISNFRSCENGTMEPIVPVKRHSTPGPQTNSPGFPSENIPKSQSLNTDHCNSSHINRGIPCQEPEENRENAIRGEIKLVVRYEEEKKELIVTVLKAENLGGASRLNQTVNPYLRLCLLPGKMQKQNSKVYKHNKDPQFKQDFMFKDVNLAELQHMHVRIRVYSKGYNIMGDEVLGEVKVALCDLDLSEETRVWKKLEDKSEHEDKGFLEVAICFEPKHERLKIGILQAKGLPKRSITGQPDSYIKIRVSQPGRKEIKRETRIKKHSSHPEFNENFTFIISPRVEDMNYTTVTLTLLSHETIRTDDVIGHVRFGFRSTEKTERSHWKQVLLYPGKEYVHCHALVNSFPVI